MKDILFNRLVCPICHGRLMFTYPDPNAGHCLTGTHYFVVCSKKYNMADVIPHYTRPIRLSGFSHRFSRMDNLNYWVYHAFSRFVITCIGMDEKKGEHKITEGLEPNFGKCNVGNTPFRHLEGWFYYSDFYKYLTETEVKSLLLRLRDHFQSAELVFDGWRPFEVWLGNRYLSKSLYAGLMQWGFWQGEEIEAWDAGIRLLDEWGFFDQPEPRLDSYRWMAPLFRLFKPMRIFHFRLGNLA